MKPIGIFSALSCPFGNLEPSNRRQSYAREWIPKMVNGWTSVPDHGMVRKNAEEGKKIRSIEGSVHHDPFKDFEAAVSEAPIPNIEIDKKMPYHGATDISQRPRILDRSD